MKQRGRPRKTKRQNFVIISTIKRMSVVTSLIIIIRLYANGIVVTGHELSYNNSFSIARAQLVSYISYQLLVFAPCLPGTRTRTSIQITVTFLITRSIRTCLFAKSIVTIPSCFDRKTIVRPFVWIHSSTINYMLESDFYF